MTESRHALVRIGTSTLTRDLGWCECGREPARFRENGSTVQVVDVPSISNRIFPQLRRPSVTAHLVTIEIRKCSKRLEAATRRIDRLKAALLRNRQGCPE